MSQSFNTARTAADVMQSESLAAMRIAQRALGSRRRFDLLGHLYCQREFSQRTFGPGLRTEGISDHIRKELVEIAAAPNDHREWIDVVLLALDGAWRTGATPEQIVEALAAKQATNEARTWPDWRTAEPGKAIEHVRQP